MRLYRYADLINLRIVSNRVTLGRWTKNQGFPQPIQLGPNSVAWEADAVDAWVRVRQRTVKPAQDAVDTADRNNLELAQA